MNQQQIDFAIRAYENLSKQATTTFEIATEQLAMLKRLIPTETAEGLNYEDPFITA